MRRGALILTIAWLQLSQVHITHKQTTMVRVELDPMAETNKLSMMIVMM